MSAANATPATPDQLKAAGISNVSGSAWFDPDTKSVFTTGPGWSPSAAAANPDSAGASPAPPATGTSASPTASAVGGLAAATPPPAPGSSPSAGGTPSSTGGGAGAPNVPYNISTPSAMRAGIGQRAGSNLNPALIGLKNYY